MLLRSILFLSLFVCSFSFASIQDDFEQLKNVPRSYQDSGSICEEVARLRLADKYPAPQYEVVTGIAYGDDVRTIGELDVIVFDRNTNKALHLAEVKCWKDARGGLKKAHEQRARFMKNIRSGKNLYFYGTTSGNHQYEADQFRYVQDFTAIAQKDTMRVGYDYELDYTLKELHSLRIMMIQCQQRGECVRESDTN